VISRPRQAGSGLGFAVGHFGPSRRCGSANIAGTAWLPKFFLHRRHCYMFAIVMSSHHRSAPDSDRGEDADHHGDGSDGLGVPHELAHVATVSSIIVPSTSRCVRPLIRLSITASQTPRCAIRDILCRRRLPTVGPCKNTQIGLGILYLDSANLRQPRASAAGCGVLLGEAGRHDVERETQAAAQSRPAAIETAEPPASSARHRR